MELTTPKETPRRVNRSPNYPSVSLRQAFAGVTKLHRADRQNWITPDAAVLHLGFKSLNGSSRMFLSALRKFGLIDTRKGDLRVSDLAVKLLHPHNDAERYEALREALRQPRLYAWAFETFPGTLPSKETFRSRLIRDQGFTAEAATGLIDGFMQSVEFVEEHAVHNHLSHEVEVVSSTSENVAESPTSTQHLDHHQYHHGLERFGLPGAPWHVVLPQDMGPEEARRMKAWVEKVLIPQLDFLADVTV